MKAFWIGLSIFILVASVLAASRLFVPGTNTVSLSGQVFDAVSGMPIYGVRITYGNRSTTRYLSKEFKLTSLPKGQGTLKAKAPGYLEAVKKIHINGEKTTVSIALHGKEVPGLGGVLVWGTAEKDGLMLDIRLTTAEGIGIERFPSLSFRSTVMISENLGPPQAPIRGKVLYEGSPKIYFDYASKLEKLKCRIPWSEIREQRSGVNFWVLDFELRTQQGAFHWTRGDITARHGES